MKPFFAALQFLTVIPVPAKLAGGTDELEESVSYFPLAGLLIGLIAAGFDRVLFPHLPPFVTSILVVMLLVMISGGLHMDGLADTADGFLSARSREKMLEIMRDSRTGVMGTIAVVFAILFKVAVLNPIPLDLRWKAILFMPFAGRVAIVLMMTLLPYVRTEGGVATLFQKRRSRLHVLWAAVFLFAAWWLMGGWMGFTVGLFPLAAAALFSVYCFRKIGGFTGDTLGAVCEITEIVVPLVMLVWM
jgi:adenosylcobinamide-GDP ribazoletransferase